LAEGEFQPESAARVDPDAKAEAEVADYAGNWRMRVERR
jgi:hypothetical protein